MLKAVIFDVDGVLIDSFEANLKFYENLFKAVGYISITRERYRQTFHHSMEEVIREVIKSNNEAEVVRIWEYAKNHRSQLYPYEFTKTPDGYRPVIVKLSRKYKLGIVTSRIRDSVFKIPQFAKLEKYFSDAVYFEDTQKHKPDPEPLLLSAQRLNFKPAEMVYIGDMESDLTAARAANMKIILYSKIKLPGADAIASDFSRLPDLIDSLI
jgi:pyrophosphatase PpaX